MTKSVKQPPELKKRKLSIKQKRKHNFSLGEQGENLAVEFLKNKDYQVLDTNVSFQSNEIDIIALDQELNELTFIEVKTRSTGRWGHPSLAVNRNKIKALQKVAHAWKYKHNLANDYRFDIITVLLNKDNINKCEIEHFENVTWGKR